MIEPGSPLPVATVWEVQGEARTLHEITADAGRALLCFTPFDWSPT